jgi:hypothetical protein
MDQSTLPPQKEKVCSLGERAKQTTDRVSGTWRAALRRYKLIENDSGACFISIASMGGIFSAPSSPCRLGLA